MNRRGHVFLVLVIGFSSLGLTAAVAVDTRVIDVVEVTWPGARKAPADATGIAKIINNDVNARWKTFTTLYGDTKDRTINFISGEVLTTPIAIARRMPCTGPDSDDFMKLIKSEAYSRLGISDYSKRYLLIITPRAGCVWSGRATLGEAKSASGLLVLHDSDSSFVILFRTSTSSFLYCSIFLLAISASATNAFILITTF